MIEYYLWLKALHVIAVIAWMAAIFFIVLYAFSINGYVFSGL